MTPLAETGWVRREAGAPKPDMSHRRTFVAALKTAKA